MENTNETSGMPENAKTKDELQTSEMENTLENLAGSNNNSEITTEILAEEPMAEISVETIVPELELTAETDAPVQITEEQIEELEPEPLENFSGYTKEELTKRMEELCVETDLNSIRNKVAQAREAFNAIVAHEKATALSLHLEEGKNAEEFEHFPDGMEERFRKAYSKYSKLKADFILGQEKIREENLKTKKEILLLMKNLIQNENNMGKAFNEFHELQARWRNTGAVPQGNVQELWMNFKLYVDRFYDFIKINRELQALDQKKNLEMKLHLCELAEGLILETKLNKAMNEAIGLQNKWKETGFVSKELGNELWTRFRNALDKVFENKKQYLEELEKKHAANYEAKVKLCEQLEAFAESNYEQHQQWQDAQKNMMELQNEWKKIGPSSKATNDVVWKRFRTGTDNFFKVKDEFYKKKKSEFAVNLQAKTEICIQAEGLQENSDWKATTDELIRLQNEWKKYGQVGSNEKNQKLWLRFKAACDVFFNRKKENFASKDAEQEQNLNKKMDLISRVENFVVNKEDAEGNLEQLKSFQREWSELGMVPLKKKEVVWDKFREAIKIHFDALQVRPDFRAGATYSTERSSSAAKPNGGSERDITNKMNKLKDEVMQLENNIEFFAKSKGPNLIKQEYEKKIQASKDEIAKLKAKLKEIKNAE